MPEATRPLDRDLIAARAQDRDWSSGPLNGGGSRRFTKHGQGVDVTYNVATGEILGAKFYDGPGAKPAEQIRGADKADLRAQVIAWFDRAPGTWPTPPEAVVDVDPPAPEPTPEPAPEPVAPVATMKVRIDGAIVELTGEQVDRFKAAQRTAMLEYAQDAATRSAVLRATVEYLRGDLTPELVGDALAEARAAERAAAGAARAVALLAIEDMGGKGEQPIAKRIGVDRMTIRKWRGKRV